MFCSLGGTNGSPEAPVSLLQLQQVEQAAPCVSVLVQVPFSAHPWLLEAVPEGWEGVTGSHSLVFLRESCKGVT